jgi:predicted lysophospholipase L1 biosynthesis ABC-type transport system permease subunit
LFPNESPIGQQVQYDDIWRTVVGVVGHVEIGGVDRPLDDPQAYVGFAPGYSYSRSLAGRTTGQPMIVVVDPADSGAALPAALRDAAKAVGPNVIVRRVRDGREWWSDNVVTPRQRTVLLSILGGLGLLLALVGVFGVTSFAVARRVSEIGVRLAFGARPRQVVAAMVKDAAIPIALGITAGLVAAFFLTRVIATFLYGTGSRDPGAFAAAACLLALCGVIAAWLPARRAARVDPVTALRSD